MCQKLGFGCCPQNILTYIAHLQESKVLSAQAWGPFSVGSYKKTSQIKETTAYLHLPVLTLAPIYRLTIAA
jgi:hypothetical protein